MPIAHVQKQSQVKEREKKEMAELKLNGSLCKYWLSNRKFEKEIIEREKQRKWYDFRLPLSVFYSFYLYFKCAKIGHNFIPSLNETESIAGVDDGDWEPMNRRNSIEQRDLTGLLCKYLQE